MADHSNPNVIALKPPDAKDIKQRLLQSLPSTLHALLPNGVLRAGKFIVGDISGGKGESLVVEMDGSAYGMTLPLAMVVTFLICGLA